jgi:hypothetical protein
MASSPSPSWPALRWGFRLSLLAGGIAAAVLSLQPRLASSFSSSSSSSNDGDRTYCYQAVRTAALNPEKKDVNCFSVSPEKGTFTRVFQTSDSSSEYEIRPGYVLPGLWDGHGHLLPYGEFLHSADLFGAASPDEVRRRLRSYLDRNPVTGTRESWARGIGWDQMVLGEMPTAAGIPLFPFPPRGGWGDFLFYFIIIIVVLLADFWALTK